ncbi:saccharopine dehydrogenase [Protomyces lactucae-debilis]|uniref:Saccharopine dehydrogenase [NADP(+), L-glutamate-forming] n=1 Tax=Protomyces lactucae-debilis TaxID=2754530 RepID=A0A1Y2FUI6_PROLT|nr:saccharopine dehydrogenase [Protomyces lactucae-debilis]ORY87673.1 saccharopine dehydrogenase [Protomyces lactucae-debilis]
MPSILLLGSGFVAHPTLSHLAQRKENQITVACRTLAKAQAFIQGVANTKAAALDVTDEAALSKAVSEHDLVISLIPYVHHVKVIEAAIKHKKHVVTTSYVSDAIAALDEKAKEAGITIMNEIGVDPGVDHLYAVKTIDEVHARGGKIKSFLSYCGGLPAPEASNNPLGYKFSWSSRGVLLALRNAAKYYKDGKIVEVAGPELMGEAKPYFIYPGFALVAYPNRDSTPYKERYNIPEAETIIRGTLRYQGFPEFIKALVDIGMLEDAPLDYLSANAAEMSWKDVFAKVIGASSTSEKDIEWTIASKTKFKSTEDKNRILAGLRWIGLLSDAPAPKAGNALDALCQTLEEKCQFGETERDLLLLQHKFEIINADGSQETRTSTLCDYGTVGGYSAMAKLVGVPCGVAVQQVLDGVISERGVLAPINSKINGPLIKDLKALGIECIEEVVA